jgi:hypothetical protein
MDHYAHKYPIIYFSDYTGERWADFITVPDPEPLRASKNKVAVQNFVWLNAIKIAKEHGLDRFCYLESDVRVGCDNWDELMFNEWIPGSTCMGTPNLFNVEAMPKQYWPILQDYIQRYTDQANLPVAQFLANEKTKRLGSCMFHMGAGAIYDTQAMLELFPNFESCISSYALPNRLRSIYTSGLRMFQMHGAKALERCRS